MAESKLGNKERAEAAFQQAAKVNQKLTPRPDPNATYQYIKFLLENARAAEAEKMIDEVIERSPDFGPTRFERAKLLAKRHQSCH